MEGLFSQYCDIRDIRSLNKNLRVYAAASYMIRMAQSMPVLRSALSLISPRHPEIDILIARQKACTTYSAWLEVSLCLDELLGNSAWKTDPSLGSYDYKMVRQSLDSMRAARLNKDYKLLIYLIRTRWTRNLGNMGDKSLYRHSHVGTKHLIEDYVEECSRCLDYLVNDRQVHLEDRYLLGMLIQTRKNIGRTALVLSGGSTFGIFHIGVLICLIENNLLPRIISGSSAGLIMASILCCHTNEEIIELLGSITTRKFNIFNEPEDPAQLQGGAFKALLSKLAHFLKYGTLYDMTGLAGTMKGFVGELTFREAYNRTGKILNITVSPASIHEQTRLLNYLTAPHCLIWLAVCASCSLPGIFPSTSIYEKTPRTNEIHEWNNDASMKYVDGSVDNDLPITRLSEMFNVDHIIAVQVNPHVVPILKVSVSSVGGEIENDLNYKLKQFLNNVYDFALCELIHYFQIFNEMDVYKNLSNKIISILSQNYSGDITILPNFKLGDFKSILVNPTPEFILDFITRGARAAWPKMTVIKNHCGVEFALDKAITLLRGRLITSAAKQLMSKRTATSNSPNGPNPLLIPVHDKSVAYTPPATSPINNGEGLMKAPASSRLGVRRMSIKRHKSYNTHRLLSSVAAAKRNSTAQFTAPSTHVGPVPPPRTPTRARGISVGRAHAYGASSLKTEYTTGSETIMDHELVKMVSPSLLSPSPNTEGAIGLRKNPVETLRQEKRNLRKAKSSGNIWESRNSRGAPLLRKPNPAWMSQTFNPYFDATEALPVKEPLSLDEKMRDNANLPNSSSNCSRRNSYIGLSRLKEGQSPIVDTSGVKYHQETRLYETNDQFVRSLHSPDLRRSLTSGFMKEFKFSKGLDQPQPAPPDNSRVKWDLGRNIITASSASSESQEDPRHYTPADDPSALLRKVSLSKGHSSEVDQEIDPNEEIDPNQEIDPTQEFDPNEEIPGNARGFRVGFAGGIHDFSETFIRNQTACIGSIEIEQASADELEMYQGNVDGAYDGDGDMGDDENGEEDIDEDDEENDDDVVDDYNENRDQIGTNDRGNRVMHSGSGQKRAIRDDVVILKEKALQHAGNNFGDFCDITNEKADGGIYLSDHVEGNALGFESEAGCESDCTLKGTFAPAN